MLINDELLSMILLEIEYACYAMIELWKPDVYEMGDNIHVMLVFLEGWVCICVMHESLNAYAWLYLDCELWTNPQWSFGWPPSLFVWIDRWCAEVVAWWVAWGKRGTSSFTTFFRV